jgi:hypothetical protein
MWQPRRLRSRLVRIELLRPGSASPSGRRPPPHRPTEQVGRLDVHGLGQLVDDIDAGRVKTPFQRTYVSAIDIGEVREFLLRKPLRLPQLPQIDRKDLPDIHPRQSKALSRISPQSILYKTPRCDSHDERVANPRRSSIDRRFRNRILEPRRAESFPVTRLKIDKSFITDLVTNENDRAVTAAVISLGQKLNLRVIAEGVETEDQMAFLRENNCDEMQGYHFSRPVPRVKSRSCLERCGSPFRKFLRRLLLIGCELAPTMLVSLRQRGDVWNVESLRRSCAQAWSATSGLPAWTRMVSSRGFGCCEATSPPSPSPCVPGALSSAPATALIEFHSRRRGLRYRNPERNGRAQRRGSRGPAHLLPHRRSHRRRRGGTVTERAPKVVPPLSTASAFSTNMRQYSATGTLAGLSPRTAPRLRT